MTMMKNTFHAQRACCAVALSYPMRNSLFCIIYIESINITAVNRVVRQSLAQHENTYTRIAVGDGATV